MICCVTGHRPKGFPFPYDSRDPYYIKYLDILKRTVEGLVGEGYTHFISGMAEGADLDFASTVYGLSRIFENIVLESALPYPLPTVPCDIETSKLRHSLISKSCTITVVSPKYFNGCMQKRNRYIVDSSDLVLAVWNGEKRGGTWYTIDYALKKGKQVRYIMLSDII